MTGFTLIELLIVVAMTFLVAALTLPVALAFVESQVLDEMTNDVASVLRRANSQAVFGKHASSFGVKILPSSFVLFEGSSYAERVTAEDEIFSFSSNLNLSGPDEIVFAKISGTTSATGTISISVSNKQREITVYENGKIEK